MFAENFWCPLVKEVGHRRWLLFTIVATIALDDLPISRWKKKSVPTIQFSNLFQLKYFPTYSGIWARLVLNNATLATNFPIL